MSIQIFNSNGSYIGPDVSKINNQGKNAIAIILNNFAANTKEARILKALGCTIYLWGLTHWDKNNNSIDIQTFPVSGCFMIAEMLKASGQTVYISSYNRHVHFDNRSSGIIQVELLQRNGRIYRGKTPTEKTPSDVISIGNFEKEKMYLFFWYGLDVSRFSEKYDTTLFLTYYNINHDDYFEFYNSKLPDILSNVKEAGKLAVLDIEGLIKKYAIIIGAGIIAILVIPKILKK